MEAGLSKGSLLPPFYLAAANREGQISLWDYKSRKNLALIFVRGIAEDMPLLKAVADHYARYQELESEVLAITPRAVEALHPLTHKRLWPFPILSDQDMRFWRQCLGNSADQVRSGAVALVADRWGEVYAKMYLDPNNVIQDEVELRNWLQFVEIQCAECFPPEWPAFHREQ